MRVHSVLEVSAHLQQNQSILQNVGTATTGDIASGASFRDYLSAHFQQLSAPRVTRQAEHLTASLVWGSQPQMKVSPRYEPELKGSAS